MKIEQYFGDKIEQAIRFYESRSKKIDGAYLAQVEKLAERSEDLVWARFVRETVQPNRIAEVLRRIRFLLAQGEVVQADRALERFKRNIEWVEQHLARPYLMAGIGTSRGGKKSAAAKWANVDGRADKMRRMFEKERAKGLLKGEADQTVARFFKVSTKTVRVARVDK
jgi:hypothetical protein